VEEGAKCKQLLNHYVLLQRGNSYSTALVLIILALLRFRYVYQFSVVLYNST